MAGGGLPGTGDRSPSCEDIERYVRFVGLRFGPDEEDEFEAASDDLVGRFESATEGQQGWAARDVMGYKWRYLDGDLTTWSVDDVETLLFEIYPAKVNLRSGGHERFHRRVRRLPPLPVGRTSAVRRNRGTVGLSGGGRPGGVRGGHERPGALQPRQTPHGRDDGRRRRSDGPRSDEPVGHTVQRSRFRRARSRSWSVAGASPTLRRRGGERTRLLPVVLVPEAEAARRPGAAVISRQMRDLVSFMASGRKLTDKGNLTVADGRTLVALLRTDDLSGRRAEAKAALASGARRTSRGGPHLPGRSGSAVPRTAERAVGPGGAGGRLARERSPRGGRPTARGNALPGRFGCACPRRRPLWVRLVRR